MWAAIAGVAAVVIIIGLAVGLSVNKEHATGALCRNSPTASATSWVSSAGPTCFGQLWNVSGRVSMVENYDGSVDVSVSLSGLPPSTRHGFHVHTVGSTANDCIAAGAHFNPAALAHGGPMNSTRHVGDLGNIQTDASGAATVSFTDSVISLTNAVRNITGRALVVHCQPDDYGMGPNPPAGTSNTTGNAGNRTACAILAAGAPLC